jgi:hypothetical protein
VEVKEQKPEVKKHCTSLYNKYKRKREDDENVGSYKGTRGDVLLNTSNMCVNFFQMMKRA